MVLQLLKQPRQITQPLLNEMGGPVSFDDMQRIISRRIINGIKQTPELVGMIDTVVTDHFQGPIDFFDVNEKPLGSTNLKQAKRKWIDWKVMQAFQGQGFDYFYDGSSFGWWNSIENSLSKKQKEVVSGMINNFGDAKTKDLPHFVAMRSLMNEQVKEPKKIWYLAASTVEIIHNEFGELRYKQEASGKQILWKPEEVVHIKLMEFNGEMRGFSGLKALIKEISIMFMIKENMIASLSNGGSPDNIIAIKNANGASKARFNRLRTALESFSHVRKSHGNMPIDADVAVLPLGSSLKDMEYRELAMFVISEFCVSIGLPTSRVPFMMTGQGGTSNKGELSGNSEDAYQKKVNNRRTRWEHGWNPIFRKAGFTFKFRRDNLQDDVRETQASTQRAAYVMQINSGLNKQGKQLTLPAHLAILSGKKMDIGEDDVEKANMEMLMMNQGGGGIPNDSRNPKIMNKSKVSQDKSASKKRTADNKGVNS